MLNFTAGLPILPPIIDPFTPTALSYWESWYAPFSLLALYLLDRKEETGHVSRFVTCLVIAATALAVAAVFIPRPSELAESCGWAAAGSTCAVCFLLLVDAARVSRLHRNRITLPSQNNENS